MKKESVQSVLYTCLFDVATEHSLLGGETVHQEVAGTEHFLKSSWGSYLTSFLLG